MRVQLAGQYRDRIDKLGPQVARRRVPMPLASLGTITAGYVPALLTRQDMQNSIDIYGLPEMPADLPRHGQRPRALEGMNLPAGYRIIQEGDTKQGRALRPP